MKRYTPADLRRLLKKGIPYNLRKDQKLSFTLDEKPYSIKEKPDPNAPSEFNRTDLETILMYFQRLAKTKSGAYAGFYTLIKGYPSDKAILMEKAFKEHILSINGNLYFSLQRDKTSPARIPILEFKGSYYIPKRYIEILKFWKRIWFDAFELEKLEEIKAVMENPEKTYDVIAKRILIKDYYKHNKDKLDVRIYEYLKSILEPNANPTYYSLESIRIQFKTQKLPHNLENSGVLEFSINDKNYRITVQNIDGRRVLSLEDIEKLRLYIDITTKQSKKEITNIITFSTPIVNWPFEDIQKFIQDTCKTDENGYYLNLGPRIKDRIYLKSLNRTYYIETRFVPIFKLIVNIAVAKDPTKKATAMREIFKSCETDPLLKTIAEELLIMHYKRTNEPLTKQTIEELLHLEINTERVVSIAEASRRIGLRFPELSSDKITFTFNGKEHKIEKMHPGTRGSFIRESELESAKIFGTMMRNIRIGKIASIANFFPGPMYPTGKKLFVKELRTDENGYYIMPLEIYGNERKIRIIEFNGGYYFDPSEQRTLEVWKTLWIDLPTERRLTYVMHAFNEIYRKTRLTPQDREILWILRSYYVKVNSPTEPKTKRDVFETRLLNFLNEKLNLRDVVKIFRAPTRSQDN